MRWIPVFAICIFLLGCGPNPAPVEPPPQPVVDCCEAMDDIGYSLFCPGVYCEFDGENFVPVELEE